jgi:SAM-dependent methyltransferase
MPAAMALHPFVRFFYRQFYNRFAFTYDFVSAVVSRGDWRSWAAASIPFLHGPHILEVAFGTGNLQLDLYAAGLTSFGVDLSPFMIELTRRKLEAHRVPIRLVRARAQQLPFPTGHFDSLVMTFPPGFITDPLVMAELRRLLHPAGRLVWVDVPYLFPRDPWSRFLNWAFRITGGAAEPHTRPTPKPPPGDGGETRTDRLEGMLPREGWSWQIETSQRRSGYVHVFIGVPIQLVHVPTS